MDRKTKLIKETNWETDNTGNLNVMTLSKNEFIKLEEELKLSDKRYRYKGELEVIEKLRWRPV